jgi:thioredoxin 1
MNRHDLNDIVAQNDKVLVHFTAEWCNPCKRMQPNIDTFLQEQPDVKYVRIDVDENAGISREMEVQSVPTLIAYNNGESTRNVGALPLPDIRKLF